jgi:hypothetical protein
MSQKSKTTRTLFYVGLAFLLLALIGSTILLSRLHRDRDETFSIQRQDVVPETVTPISPESVTATPYGDSDDE